MTVEALLAARRRAVELGDASLVRECEEALDRAGFVERAVPSEEAPPPPPRRKR